MFGKKTSRDIFFFFFFFFTFSFSAHFLLTFCFIHSFLLSFGSCLSFKMPGRSKKDKGLSIAEEVGDDDDITSWVQKSRKMEQKKKKEEERQAKARAQAFDELDNEEVGDFEKAAARSFYLPKDIAGMKVTHDLNEIEAGDDVILTLKDQAILDENYEENDEDALENIHLSEGQRLAEIKRLKQKKTKYDVYDMDKKQDLLPQYNDDDEGPAFVLPSVRSAAAKKQQEQVRAKLQAMKKNLKKVDASGPAGSAVSDFRSEEEEAALSFKKKPKKKRKIRSKPVEESGGSLVDILESQAASSRNGGLSEDKDHGSRRRNVAKESKEKREEEEKTKRDAGYAFARLKAKQKSQNEYGSTLDVGEAAMDVMETYTGDAMDELEQEEDALYNSLARSRKGSVKKVNASEIRRRALETKAKEEESEAPVGGMVFSETTEFCRLVSKEEKSSSSSSQRVKKEKLEEKEEKEDEKGETEEENGEVKTEEGDAEDVEMAEVKEEKQEDGEEGEEDEGAADLVDKQPLVGRGLAATLAFMQSTSMTSESMYIGRQGDKSAEFLDPNDNDHIRIEHRDEYGRMITPKEAFRTMSHKFHGKPPGKNKQEKRLKRYLEDQRKNHMSATDTPLNTVSALKKAQKKSGSAFVVIDGSGDRSAHTGGSHTPMTKGFRGTQTPGFKTVEPEKKGGSSGGEWVKIETGVKRKREEEDS